MISDSKQYMIDGNPVTARELINEAALIDRDYASDPIKITSDAARILRNAGHTVEVNPSVSA